jgi:hypothetical protein
MGSSGLGLGPVARSCGHGDDISGSIKGGEFLKHLSEIVTGYNSQLQVFRITEFRKIFGPTNVKGNDVCKIVQNE